jgi:hypothetical protein
MTQASIPGNERSSVFERREEAELVEIRRLSDGTRYDLATVEQCLAALPDDEAGALEALKLARTRLRAIEARAEVMQEQLRAFAVGTLVGGVEEIAARR